MARNRTVVGPQTSATAKPLAKISEDMIQTLGKALEPLAYASKVQMGIGCDLIGKAMTMSSAGGNVLAITQAGIVAYSKKTGRCVLVPYANIRGCELERIQVQPKTTETKDTTTGESNAAT